MATELGAIHLPNHELPTCRQSDGKFKKSYRSLEAAEAFAKSIHDRYGDELQRAYECTITPGHFHLTTADYVPLEDRTSTPYARPRPLIPVASEDESQERFRSTSANVRARREKVQEIVSQNPDKIYAEMAEILGIEKAVFISDVKYLIDRNMLPPRQNRTASNQKASTKVPATTKLAEVEAHIQQMLAAKAELEAQVAQEEAARLEREKVHVSWINGNTGNELSVRKNTQLMIFIPEEWREIIAAVAAEIQDK